jgi:4-amino-4-deoxy-L-arabinose transferase-like glycosyltransferase
MTGAGGLTAFQGAGWRILVPVFGITVLWAVIASWNIGLAGFSDFYSSAARSMSISWPAFFTGSFDPSGSITLDKLSGFLVPQALSARLFGFSATSIAVPQVLEGIVTLLAVYTIAARWKGQRVGLLALGAAATTPLLASMFGHIMEDGLLTMSLALAFLFWQTSARSGRLLPLMISALWVAIGFQAKMMQAWLILPAIVVGILLTNGHPFAGRLRRALLFVGVALLGSVLWMSILQLLPATDRPYFDGSTNDNVFTMVFGYNGFNRLIPDFIPGASPDFVHRVISHGSAGANPWKLLLPAFATQVGWLYPTALAGVVLVIVAAVARRRLVGGAPVNAVRDARSADVFSPVSGPVDRPLPNPVEGAMGACLAVWLILSVALLSTAAIPHTAYYAAISVQVAVFAALGAAEAVSLYRSRRATAVLPVLLALQVTWIVVLLSLTGVAPAWLVTAVIVLGAIAVVFFAVGAVSSHGRTARRTAGIGLAVGLAAALLAPATWTGSVIDLSLDGSANDAHAGPLIGNGSFFFSAPGSREATTSFRRFAIGAPVLTAPARRLSDAQGALADWLQKRVPAGHILMATDSWGTASPYILRAGLSVLPMGGFSGAVPSPSLSQARSLVHTGTVRYFLFPTRPQTSGTQLQRRHPVESWVERVCRPEITGVPTPAGHTLWNCSALASPPREPR